MENTMKTSIATTLSVLGVLAAGAAAYAVNTSVLGAAAEDAPAIVADAPTSTVASTPPGLVTNAAVQSQQSEASNTTTYKVGDAGSVVIDTSSGSIVVTSILPAVGFTSEPARADANGVVKVHFVSASQRIEFVAKMQNGVVVTEVVNETPPPAAQQPRHDDDDDDDHERYEDHDDDDDDHYEDGDDD